MTLQAGWAAVEITPPVGTDMGGYWGRPGPSLGIHDPLYGRVLAFELHGQRVGVISLDLVGLDADVAQQLCERISARIDSSPENLLLCATHTHSGPLSLSFRGMGEVPVEYVEGLAPMLIEAARQAVDGLAPCHLTTTSVDVEMAINRRAQLRTLPGGRDPAGLVPSQAHALQIATDAGSAVLVHYACHPVILGGANRLLSADWPGSMVGHIEQAMGAELAMFINGACGDLNPPLGNADFDVVQQLGMVVGRAVVEGLSGSQPMLADVIGATHERIDLPLMDPPSALSTAARASIDSLKLAIKKAAFSDDLSLRRVPEARLAWARELLSLPREAMRHQSFAIKALRIGKLRLIGLEGEIFARYQIDLEQHHELAWLCGYVGGCVGYIPTADEYDRGGYEIDDAYKVYPSVLMVSPDAETLVRASIERALATLG
ncbi:MAG: neutral/alkaline non-lysosomal ceramidase N-terminal domain-containing protein [Candidatus Latescibacterota bacterium]|nr:neutral/alkaline non-lysosomal ceramidase N-terminal domain-containing protein [Candidatus Latescibacterota bacterium]